MITAKQKAALYLKNSFGWSTKRKIVVFSVDDYGNVRIASKQARENLKRSGLKLDDNRFDRYDTLETKEDLTHLFEVLNSVKDRNNRPAVFTPFALPANIDFNKMEAEDFSRYSYELLPNTLHRLPGYEGTWELWLEGINKNFFVPQFHGREHVNVAFLLDMLKERNPLVLSCLRERCWAGLHTIQKSKTVSYVSAFSFDRIEEHDALAEIAVDGLEAFQKVFGFNATHFNSPGTPAHTCLEKALAEGGIKYVDAPFIKREHQGRARYRYRVACQGRENKYGQRYIVRNCVFEPLLSRHHDSVTATLAEIDVAFQMRKPAIISSHRVNFCGLIDEQVRSHGLRALKRLLGSIMKRWPDVEFMASPELGAVISNDVKLLHK